jgi:hypothetical protein
MLRKEGMASRGQRRVEVFVRNQDEPVQQRAGHDELEAEKLVGEDARPTRGFWFVIIKAADGAAVVRIPLVYLQKDLHTSSVLMLPYLYVRYMYVQRYM